MNISPDQVHALNPVIRDEFLHVDFLRVSAATKVTVDIPVVFLNEEECTGLTRGGLLNVVRHEIEMSCRADANGVQQVRVNLEEYKLGQLGPELDYVGNLLSGDESDRSRFYCLRTERQPLQHELPALVATWQEERTRLDPGQVERFNERLHREWAIETGILEKIYTLDRGTTQLLIERGMLADQIEGLDVAEAEKYTEQSIRERLY